MLWKKSAAKWRGKGYTLTDIADKLEEKFGSRRRLSRTTIGILANTEHEEVPPEVLAFLENLPVIDQRKWAAYVRATAHEGFDEIREPGTERSEALETADVPIEDSMSTIESKLDALGSKLDAVAGQTEAKLDTLGAKLDALLSGVAGSVTGKLDAMASALVSMLGSLSATLDGVKRTLHTATGTLGAATGKLDAATGKLDVMEGKLDPMANAFATVAATVNHLDAKADVADYQRARDTRRIIRAVWCVGGLVSLVVVGVHCQPAPTTSEAEALLRAALASVLNMGKKSEEHWIPKEPAPWQKLAKDCDPAVGEVAINGGCWVWIAAVQPPCEKLFRYGDACYRPVAADPTKPVGLFPDQR